MARRQGGWLGIWALVAILAGAAVGRAQEPGELPAFFSAARQLNDGSVQLAALEFENFLNKYPKSAWAAEALYKLGAAQLVLGKPDEARKLWDRLLDKHFDSPWSVLLLRSTLDGDALLALGNRLRTRARESGRPGDYQAAFAAFEAYLRRFASAAPAMPPQAMPPQAQPQKAEAFYKLADCMRREVMNWNETMERDQLLRSIQANDKDGCWGKLATFWLEDAKYFLAHLDDLLDLNAPDSEHCHAFLALLDRHAAALTADDRVKGQYYRARCLEELKKPAEAQALYQRLQTEHPASPWAAESGFWLAEKQFHDDRSKAAAAYRAFAAKYPASARAAVAARWAAALDADEADWKVMKEALTALQQRVSQKQPSLALRLAYRCADPGKAVDARMAFQINDGRSRAYLGVTAQGHQLLFASDKEGTCFGIVERGQVLKAKRAMDVPCPVGEVESRPDGSFNYKFRTAGPAEPTPPAPFTFNGAVAADAVKYGRSHLHLSHREHKDAAGKPTVVYVLEWPSRASPAPVVLELDLDNGHMVREVRILIPGDKDSSSTWTLADLRLNEPLPDDTFRVAVPPGLAVVEVPEINPLEVMGQGFGFLTALYNNVSGKKE